MSPGAKQKELQTWRLPAVGQNPVLVNIKIDGTWVFIRPKLEAKVLTHGQMFLPNVSCIPATGSKSLLVSNVF